MAQCPFYKRTYSGNDALNLRLSQESESAYHSQASSECQTTALPFIKTDQDDVLF
jgi:hypothetical protein